MLWAFLFVMTYGLTLFLVSAFVAYPNALIMIALQVQTPLLYLFFAWRYFRRAAENNWGVRFFIGGLWVTLTVIGNAILVQPVYGYDWTYAVTPYVLQGQLFNVAAVLVGAYVGNRPRAKIINLPKKVEKKLEQRGI